MNTDFTRFTSLPADVKVPRSQWKAPTRVTTTFNAGKLIPIGLPVEVIPGDTISLDMGFFARMSTPIHPVMDDCFYDIHWYFVPWRLIWDNYDKFFGANDDPWAQTYDYTIPQLAFPRVNGAGPGSTDVSSSTSHFDAFSVADYFGIPTQVDGSVVNGVATTTINALPFRAYGKVWNDYYRDENLMLAIDIPKDDVTRNGARYSPDASYGQNFLTAAIYGGAPAPVCKYHDYFTSSLPEPQRGEDVILPLSTSDIPVDIFADGALKLSNPNNYTFSTYVQDSSRVGLSGTNLSAANNSNLSYSSGLSGNVDTSDIVGPTINALREAFSIQRIYELDALYGTRYNESVKGHFGVTVPDYRAQRSEYIGGTHIRCNMSQVLQTSSTDSVSPQGNTAAFSATGDRKHMFTYSAVEHGYVMGFVMLRNIQSYQQGLAKLWSKKRRFDFYTPELANIGNQPVYNSEIYFTGDQAQNEEVFGYQEAWAEYRYLPSLKTGAMRSNTPGGGLDAWHYADFYADLPVLGPDWIAATPVNIDRTLAVSSALSDQIIADFDLNFTFTRCMPLYSTPGSLMHH